MSSMAEWYAQLYGPRQAMFNPAQVTFDPFAQAAVPADPEIASSVRSPANGGGGDGVVAGRDLPYADEESYFATPGWSPDPSWKYAAKAYAPYMAMGPVLGGIRLSSAYKNPTRDPVWQEAARQYLSRYAPGATLADVIKDINTLYAADPNAKAFASDTARGVLMGLGHLANPYQEAVMQTRVMEPYQFAQSAQGFAKMGWDPAAVPGYGWATPTRFNTVQDPVTGVWGSELSGYQSGTLAGLARAYSQAMKTPSSFYDSLSGKSYGPGERIAETAANVAASSARRADSRAWMEDILNGVTADDFSNWQDRQGSGNASSGSGLSSDRGGGRGDGSGGLAGGAIGGSTRSDGKVR